MKQKFILAGWIVLFTFLIKFSAKTQDIHYSQFYNSPLNINPALTGIFNGDVRVIGSLRDQWRSISVPYTTFSGSYDMKYLPKKSDKYFFGLGGIFNFDRAGDANYNITDLNLTGNYSYILNPNNIISGGLLLGLASEGFSPDGLTWSSQWTGTAVDPTLPSQENFNSERFTYLETGIGGNYRYQSDSSRTFANVGIGLFHLTTPRSRFIQVGNPRLPLRTALNGQVNYQLTSTFDIQGHAVYQIQGKYDELVLGGLGKLYINQKKGKLFRLDLGAAYRTSGSFIPKIAFLYNQIYVGASYDINLGQINDEFGRRGGPEVHVRYIITKVKALNQKPCPIY